MASVRKIEFAFKCILVFLYPEETIPNTVADLRGRTYLFLAFSNEKIHILLVGWSFSTFSPIVLKNLDRYLASNSINKIVKDYL